MQTIWARVAQSKYTCNCSSCISSAAVIARRSTTAVAGRRIRFSDVFTLCYSSMLATAAVVDSSWKDAKREALDRAIAQAKDELKDLDSQQQSRLAALSKKPSEEQVIKETKGAHWGDVFEWASRQREARKALGFQDWKGVPLDLLEGLSRLDIQRALEDSRISARLTGEAGSAAWNTESDSHPLSPKKLKTMEWSVAKMVTRLLSQISNDGLASRGGIEQHEDASRQQSVNTKQDFSGAISKIDERLSELQKWSQTSEIPETFESPQYPRYSTGLGTDPNVLNAILRAILEAKGAGKDSMIAKVCYNLLMSTTPPNVRIYNTLLVHFCRMEEQDMVSAVLTSMRESHVRPNEITHSTALKFYTLTQNSGTFLKYVRLMEGLDQGLAIAHPKTKRIPITAVRYRFPEDYHTPVAQFARGEDGAPVSIDFDLNTDNLHPTKIVEKARVNVEVYGALIQGALRFWGQEQAMQFYRAMISEGWHPNVTILTSILRRCCYDKDWPSGSIVWQEMQRLARNVNEKSYLWMLRLCRRCQKQNVFEEVLTDGVQRGILPSTVWELGTQIRTAEVNTLINAAKSVRTSQRQKAAQLAPRKDSSIRFDVEKHSNLKPAPFVEVLEPSASETQPERSAILPEVIAIEHHTLDPTVSAHAPSSKYHQQSIPKVKTTEMIALDPVQSEVPALYHSRQTPSSPQLTSSGKNDLCQESPPKLAIDGRKALTPYIIPAQASWPTYKEPLAATA